MSNLKIIFALAVSFIITMFLSNIFLGESPRLNRFFFSKLFSQKPSPPPPPPLPSIQRPLPRWYSAPTLTPTKKNSLLPASIPSPIKPTVTPSPPQPPAASCPTISNQIYSSLAQNPNKSNRVRFNLSASPDTNLYLRGWVEVNEAKNLISRNSNNYGLDPNMPPQISSLYNGPLPSIIKTYRVYEWDYTNQRSAAPQTATPAYPVHMLGLAATPGQPLYGLKSGRTIDGSHVFLVMYATKNYILLVHAADDVWDSVWGPDGYPFYFLDVCVDPNLLAAYERDNSGGRNQLPVIATGQIFGYALTNEVKFVVRDTMSFMDTRYKEDWWFYSQ
jgi:hypothetical protein